MTTTNDTDSQRRELTSYELAALGAAKSFMSLHAEYNATPDNSKALTAYIAANELDPLSVRSYETASAATAPELEYTDPRTGETYKGKDALEKMPADELRRLSRTPEFKRSIRRMELGL